MSHDGGALLTKSAAPCKTRPLGECNLYWRGWRSDRALAYDMGGQGFDSRPIYLKYVLISSLRLNGRPQKKVTEVRGAEPSRH